jgi:uncharacterized membrane protein YbaN (DUF454 family)
VLWVAGTLAPRVKRIALASMVLTAGFSIWFFAGTSWLQGLVLGAMMVGATVVWRLPSRKS